MSITNPKSEDKAKNENYFDLIPTLFTRDT